MLTALLTGCVSPQAGVDGQSIQARLAPVCPQPTQWSNATKTTVADAIDRHAGESGIADLAVEWERLNSAAKICRGGK